MTYPITIVDDFFEDPDGIVDMANEFRYYNPNSGYFGQKLHLLHYESVPEYWNLQCHFQLIKPFCDNKYSNKNRGWIHQDIDTFFGGIVYLTPNPEPDTGTSVYKVKRGYSHQTAKEIEQKEALYRSEDVDDMEYEAAYNALKKQ